MGKEGILAFKIGFGRKEDEKGRYGRAQAEDIKEKRGSSE